MKNEYRGSFLHFDITPNVSADNPAFLQGMAGGLREATSVAVPLSVEMCLLEDSNFTKLLFVTADIIGFDSMVVDQVRKRAVQWGIDPEGIVLNSSHTHYAPGTLSNMPETMGPYYEGYTRQILERIATSLQRLYDGLEPCTIHAGLTDVRIGVNRRYEKGGRVHLAPNPSGAYLSETPIVKIELHESRRSIVWVNHGCHPTGMGSDTRISSDYPGLLKQVLRRKQVADGVMFFQGAGGSCKQATETDDRWTFCDNIREVRRNTMKFADAIQSAIGGTLKEIDGPFFCKTQRVELCLVETASDSHSTHDMCMEVQMVCLGNRLNLLTFPMEPAAELAISIHGIDGITPGDFILGYTNGLFGYLNTDRMTDAGGYESEQSHLVYRQPGALTSGTENQIIEAVQKNLREKNKTGAHNGYGRYHHAQGPQEAFFVLSSGRCGTMTLAHLLNTATNARVWHHPEPFMVKETFEAYQNREGRERMFWRGRAPFIEKSWAQGLMHGETDHNMTPFADVIAQEIPESRFVVLVRDPRGFVRSGMRRNYYKGHPWDSGRLRPNKESAAYEKWTSYDQFEKICWLWNETYGNTLRLKSIIGNQRVTVARFEDLLRNHDEIKRIFDFLGLSNFDEQRIRSILNKKLNVQTTGNFPLPTVWSQEMHDKLWTMCSEVAEHFGYESYRAQPS